MTDNAQRNKAIVREFLIKTFTDRDFTALERWLSPATWSPAFDIGRSPGSGERAPAPE